MYVEAQKALNFGPSQNPSGTVCEKDRFWYVQKANYLFAAFANYFLRKMRSESLLVYVRQHEIMIHESLENIRVMFYSPIHGSVQYL